MKRRSLIAIILAVVCLMTSLSVYVAAACSCNYTSYCADDVIDEIAMSHRVSVGDDDVLICNYTIIVSTTIKRCDTCECEDRSTSHRHAEDGHFSCGRPYNRCTYPVYPFDAK